MGKDHLARPADIRTKRGVGRQPIVMLVVLPTNN